MNKEEETRALLEKKAVKLIKLKAVIVKPGKKKVTIYT